MSRLIRFLLRSNPKLRAAVSKGHQRFNYSLSVDDDTAALLDGIPSEATPRERRLLYRFFRTVWSGENDVIEIGPFLGGTTRAIALGMDDNPRASENSKLYTYDRFKEYYDKDTLSEYLMSLVKTGALDQAALDGLGQKAEFMHIFELVHERHNYYQRIVASSEILPDRPEDLQDGKAYFQLPENTLTDAVFIDGCKSWFGTKYFMAKVSEAARTGAYFIYQDYGWYTCFWIPVFLERLKDYFELIGYVDTTYAFQLTKPLDAEVINRQFPDEPAELGESEIVDIFDRLVEEARNREDFFAFIRHSLQRASALAYLGNKTKAKEIITGLQSSPWAFGHEKVIKMALSRPARRPDGAVTF